MERRKKIIMGVLAILLLVIIIAWPKGANATIAPDEIVPNDSEPDLDVNIPKTSITPKQIIIPDGSNDFPLKLGSKGDKVKTIQEIINFNDSAFGLTNGVYLTKDGNFGPKTQTRCIAIFGSPVITEIQFSTALTRYKKGIPFQSRMDDNFPLRIGSYGDKTEDINVALGIYKKGTPYAKNFTAKTQAAIKAKTGFVSVNYPTYERITKKIVKAYRPFN